MSYILKENERSVLYTPIKLKRFRRKLLTSFQSLDFYTSSLKVFSFGAHYRCYPRQVTYNSEQINKHKLRSDTYLLTGVYYEINREVQRTVIPKTSSDVEWWRNLQIEIPYYFPKNETDTFCIDSITSILPNQTSVYSRPRFTNSLQQEFKSKKKISSTLFKKSFYGQANAQRYRFETVCR